MTEADDTLSHSTTNEVAPGDSTNLEDLPLIVPRHEANTYQGGLFSSGSPATGTAKQIPSQSLIIGASPSNSSSQSVLKEKEQGPPHNGSGFSSGGRGFRPLIEVVSSDESIQSQEHCRPLTKSQHPLTESTVTKTNPPTSAPGQSHTHQPSSTGDKSVPPESLELGGVAQWAFTTNMTTPMSLQLPSPAAASGGLLIEEIEDDDFNVGQLPLTAAERAAINETNAALEKIKGRPVSELSEGERVWHLAASAGSTLEDRKEAELDDETKSRVRERLVKSGLSDKTSLKF